MSKPGRMDRRAQMEMIGIAIVVVIIVLGFLYMLKFMAKPASSSQAGFVRAHMAQDILNSISISDAGPNCNGIDMTDLLKACAEGTNVDCGEPCSYFKDSIKKILSGTLEEQKLPYRLRVYKGNEPPSKPADALGGVFMEYSGCNETSIKRGFYAIKEKPGFWIAPVMDGDVKVMLEICSRNY